MQRAGESPAPIRGDQTRPSPEPKGGRAEGVNQGSNPMPATTQASERTILRQRASTAVNGAFNDLAHAFDLHGDEFTADRPKWQAIRAQLVDLIETAYSRNHTVEG